MEKPTLFIYEEDPVILKTLSMALDPFYAIYSSNTMNNFKSAFQLPSSDSSFDCILIDSLHLQTFNEEVLEYIRLLSHAIPVAILLSIQDTNTIIDIVNKGFNHFISNPFSIKTLKREITATIMAFEKTQFEVQKRVASSIQYRQFRHDLFNNITVAHGYIDILISGISDVNHKVYCEKISTSLDRLVQRIKKGFITTDNDNNENKATESTV